MSEHKERLEQIKTATSYEELNEIRHRAMEAGDYSAASKAAQKAVIE